MPQRPPRQRLSSNALVVTDQSLERSRLERSRVAADAFACLVSAVWVEG
jgi:hypothetical protein